MIQSNPVLENAQTRRVIVEKSSLNKRLFIYTVRNPNLTNSEADAEDQLDKGVDIAIKYNLLPIEYPEQWLQQEKIGLSLIYLLTKVSTNDVKHVYVRSINIFCKKDKIILRYILDYLAIHNVFVYDKNGLISQDFIDVNGLENNLEYFAKHAGLICENFESLIN